MCDENSAIFTKLSSTKAYLVKSIF